MGNVKTARRAFGTLAVAVSLLFAAAMPAQANWSIYGGGDCWAEGHSYTASVLVSITSSNGTCSKIGAKHKWQQAQYTGYTNWVYETYFNRVSSDPIVAVIIPFGRAYA